MPERVVVTGAAGFIGSHLVDALLTRGDEVVGLDNFDAFYDRAIKRDNLARASGSSRFELVEGDVRDPSMVGSLLRRVRPDVVVHLAARAGVRPSIAEPSLYADVNVVGTTVLLDKAWRAGVGRIVVASSSSVYGNAARVPFREDDPAIEPVSPYAATKRAAELVCTSFAALQPQLRILSLRLFTVYGPRQRPDLAISKFARLILCGEPVPFYGDGSASRDYTYVSDVVRGILGAVDRTSAGPPGHEVYNVGGAATTTLTQLVAMLEEALGRRALLQRLPPQPGDVRRTFADVSRARAALGYAPEVPIADGIRRFVDWLRDSTAPVAGRRAR